MNVRNKKIVITGGTDGLGLALAKEFFDAGANVFVIGRDAEKVKNINTDFAGKITGYCANVTDFSSLCEIASKLGEVDVLINNAGVWLEGNLDENTPLQIENTLDTNLKGVIFATKAFLPKLLTSEESYLVNVSSTSGLRGRENQAVYAASKHGVYGFTESMKIDLAKTNVRVLGFYPGGMNTKLFEKAGIDKDNKTWMDPKKVAEVVLFMIERDINMVMDHVVVNKRL